jgi:peptide/nickel transport system permease protein
VGVLTGHFTGWLGTVLARVTEWFLVLPSLPFAITLAGVLGSGLTSLIVAIGVTEWARVARVIRAAVISEEARPHMERTRSLGAGHLHQLQVHVLPALLPVIVANTTLTLGNALLSEATLTFLGLGEPGVVSWGTMLRQAASSGAVTAGAWWYLLAPGCAITTVVLACGLAGHLAESAADPWATTRPSTSLTPHTGGTQSRFNRR